MSEDLVFDVPENVKADALVDEAKYHEMYAESLRNPEAFWGEHGKRIDWMRPYTKVKNTLYSKEDVSIKWYEDGTLNACVNCVDRHLDARGDDIAIIWEGDEPDQAAKITYRQLHEEVCRFANVLKQQGVGKGDRVTIYMPMIPEAAYAMLACARIGAIHSVVFGGFSPDALAGRIQDCDSCCVITADEGIRGGRKIPLKANTDAALEQCPGVSSVVVVARAQGDVNMVAGRDIWYHEVKDTVDAECPAEEMNAEDPLFILYTSGSTGKPKGVLHTTGGVQHTLGLAGGARGVKDEQRVFGVHFFGRTLGVYRVLDLVVPNVTTGDHVDITLRARHHDNA